MDKVFFVMCCISGEYDGNDNKATPIKKGKHLITE